MNLVQLKNASILFGQPPLIDGADFSVKRGERLCVVGRNGAGKSTLLKILSRDVKIDDGQCLFDNDCIIARLAQDPPQDVSGLVFDYVAEGLGEEAALIKEYFTVTHEVGIDPSDKNLQRLQRVQEQLDARNAWQLEQRINAVLTDLQLDGEVELKSLSGGWRRKAALARALVAQPDLLLLDEPTNHLDIDMVKWLENALLNYKGAIVFISHDRAFIRRLATRIVDIDRGKLVSYPGSYEKYLEQKAHDLAVEESQNKEFDKKLAKEEVWIRQGIKARRTRNEGRVRALKKLREEHQQRRAQVGNARIQHDTSGRSGKRVFETNGLSYAYGDKPIVSNLDLLVSRGEKIALIGPNGCGKTTLIKLLLGQLPAQAGEVFTGSNLEVAYFDQHRRDLALDKPLIDVIADGKREVEINGKPRHVISYLQDYLFSPERVNAPVSTLSGGEKNRLLLAKLMLRPHNLLVLDEPTNDLDVETLELLESLLVDYTGTILLVSHDREFVDNVATSCLVFEPNAQVQQFVGGYSDMKAWFDAQLEQEDGDLKEKTSKKQQELSSAASFKSNKKLSYKENRELESLPQTIDALEQRQRELQTEINAADFFSKTAEQTAPILQALADVESELEQAFLRWDELESLQQQLQEQDIK